MQGTVWAGDIKSEIEKNAIKNELYFIMSKKIVK